ncbi:MAG TPA: VCBS repeat-containing protein, partial [Pyrinomonadaceae bacterium]|nr:VCBS repeat-containing protein [Pyrinomonadaceae bacterium]
MHNSGSGNRGHSLNDGKELRASYIGPEDLIDALDQNGAEPLSLASADFDEDGVPDLVSGYSYAGRGIVTLLRGNLDSIYPNSPEAQQRKSNGTFTQAPFLSPGHAFEVTRPADFVGAGDFDGDSHWDVVVASRGDASLFLLSGNGKGRLSPGKEIKLAGTVTALVTGEINRRDGLTDVVVGVDASDGPKVLVFEGPEGALRSQPEIFPARSSVVWLALGQLDDDYNVDLAVATGAELLVIRGRDRKSSLSIKERAAVPAAQSSKRAFPFSIRSVAI